MLIAVELIKKMFFFVFEQNKWKKAHGRVNFLVKLEVVGLKLY